MLNKVKGAVFAAAAVLAVIFVANRVPVAKDLVAKAITPPAA